MYPTPFQKKMCWAAITALAMVALVGVVVLIGWGAVQAISILKPLIVPIAIAGIFAYLLEPVVRWLKKHRIPRLGGVLLVFLALLTVIALILLWVVPAGTYQIQHFAQRLPEYSKQTQVLIQKTMDGSKKILDMQIFRKPDPNDNVDPVTAYVNKMIQDSTLWLETKMPDIAVSIGKFFMDNFVYQGVDRVFTVLEFLLGIILIPVFLFFFLVEGSRIADRWSDYVPLHNSPL
ncbi:MAG: AI-2E family transporter, partial [Chthoniobacterales bacterium]